LDLTDLLIGNISDEPLGVLLACRISRKASRYSQSRAWAKAFGPPGSSRSPRGRFDYPTASARRTNAGQIGWPTLVLEKSNPSDQTQ